MDTRFLESEGKTLTHIGVLERSGRYAWGSGENPYQRLRDWRGYYWNLKRNGLTDDEIARSSGMTTDELKESLLSTTQRRSQTTIRNAQQKVADVARAWELKNKGYSNIAIANAMGCTEGTVRNLLKPGADAKAKQITDISDQLKKAVDDKGFIDIGAGTNLPWGVSSTKMKAITDLMKEDGYNVYSAKVKQLGTGEYTNISVLAPPGVGYKDFMSAYKEDPSIVKLAGFYAEEPKGALREVSKPVSIDRSRILVRYGDEVGADGLTGSDRDGVLQIRPGVEDLDLLGTNYAQVRVAVDDKMYMKGMAIYSKDIPDGYDVVYNVNKPKGSTDDVVFKKMYKKGPDDPFGATTKTKYVDPDTGDIVYQKDYLGKDGKRHMSALNIVSDEGTWDDWNKSLASQFLSKQSTDLAKKQLGIVEQSKQDEFDEIMSLTNPTIKKKMLEEYADNCDSAAVHLKAAALPRQATQVIIPIPSLKDNEIYAPNFRDGETVVLVRYPHAGAFESPELVVNNKNAEGIDTIGKASTKGAKIDAVGINARVARQLSGADFDGDNVLVIPNNDGSIKSANSPGMSAEPLKKLRDFDPNVYARAKDDPIHDPNSKFYKSPETLETTKQKQMGVVSNLITDMTLQGATPAELARAVKHSMVVIDSVKHDLDWKQSEKDNGIQELRDKYQAKPDGRPGGGASTLISRAKSEERVQERKELTSTRKMTKEQLEAWNRGEKVYEYTGRTKQSKVDGEWVDTGELVTKKSTKMKEAKDARTLSSGTAMEEIYAEHANKLKSLANKARAAARSTPNLEYSPSAKKVYAEEVESLNTKLTIAKRNAPLERQAQLVANAIVKAKINSNPELKEDKDAIKKANTKALEYARETMGANKKAVQVAITDREWEAIQAGAISDSKLKEILNNTDMDAVKKRATPRASTGLSPAQITRAKAMAANGLTQAEIADAIGVSISTINDAINA